MRILLHVEKITRLPFSGSNILVATEYQAKKKRGHMHFETLYSDL
jgi:hypothetical protein